MTRAGNQAGPAVALGPQCKSDNAFTARMRLHQSRYRANVLGVPCGTGPFPRSKTEYGNMLRREDGTSGLNFLSPEIHAVAVARIELGMGTVEPFRLLHNMLSSQPMCFNLFGPMVRDADLARRLIGAIPGLDVAEVLDVRIEFAPDPASEYLDDRTAFDAFVDYRRSDGARAFLGIETKLTEAFSRKRYDSPAYRRWMSGSGSPWRTEAASLVSAAAHNQLWRDHLLTVALRDHRETPFVTGKLMLVRHPADQACARVVRGYQRLLIEGDDTFVDMPLGRLVEQWCGACRTPHERRWLDAVSLRYVHLVREHGARAAVLPRGERT